jgi:hypothetical protein
MADKKKRVKQRLYEYAVIYNPLEGEGKAEVIEKGEMLGEKPDTVIRKLIRKLDDKWEDRMDDIDFLIRDFQ